MNQGQQIQRGKELYVFILIVALEFRGRVIFLPNLNISLTRLSPIFSFFLSVSLSLDSCIFNFPRLRTQGYNN